MSTPQTGVAVVVTPEQIALVLHAHNEYVGLVRVLTAGRVPLGAVFANIDTDTSTLHFTVAEADSSNGG